MEQAAQATSIKTDVFHIEDDRVWGESAGVLLEEWPEIRYKGRAATGRDGIARCHAIEPAVVLLDLVLPDMSGLEVWDRLSVMPRPPRILPFTNRLDEALLHRVALGEASGLIWKGGNWAEHLRPALAAVANGGCYFPPEVAEALRRFRRSPDAFPKVLSSWELKLVTMLASGRRNEDIALETGCSRGTIRNHWHNMVGKLGLRDRHDLRAWAEAKGFAFEARPSRAVEPQMNTDKHR